MTTTTILVVLIMVAVSIAVPLILMRRKKPSSVPPTAVVSNNSGSVVVSSYGTPNLLNPNSGAGIAITAYWRGYFAKGTSVFKDAAMTELISGHTYIAYGNTVYTMVQGVVGDTYYTKF